MEVDLNPAGGAERYLAHLNTSFGAWGDLVRYRWAFERGAGGPAPDLMVLREGAEVLAGSAVSYRAAVAGGERFRVGIMTGSWTLPASRGRGCFTRIIEESLGLCARREAPLLLAFVTEDNASYRRLRDAGSKLLPTCYWVFPAPASPAPPGPAVREVAPALEPLHRAHESRGDPGLRFTYAPEEYRGQFLARPDATEVLECAHGAAVVERAQTTDRLLALYPRGDGGPALVQALHQRAQAAGRGLFGFSGSAARAQWFAPLGVAPRAGFMTVLAATSGAQAAFADLALENGDRM